MADRTIRRGMTVYTVDNQSLGTVEEVTGNYFRAGGQQYPLNSGYRLENNNIYLEGNQNYAGTNQSANEMRVPVMEEQLNVEKRQANMGEVQVHKTVTQEQVNVPVELRREEVHVDERDITDRPLQAGEETTAFQEGTIRVPVRGEEAVVNKQAVVTGEVAINKTVTTEQQTIADSVRREHVQVDDSSVNITRGAVRTEGYQTDTTNYATDAAQGGNYQGGNYQGGNYQGGTPTNTAQRGNYQSGTTSNVAANLREGQDVVGNDGEFIGRVKELRDSEFRIDRSKKPDINVTYTAIQNVDGDQVVLNAPGADFSNFI